MSENSMVLSRRRNFVGALGATLAVLGVGSSSGCFGGFALTRKLYGFNEGVSNKWMRWLVFLLFYVFQVYTVTVIVDTFIFNSIEFWTGKRPLSAIESVEQGDQKAVVRAESPDRVVIDMQRGKAKVSRIALTRLDDAVMLESEDGRKFFVRDLHTPGDVHTEIVDSAGQALANMDSLQWKQVQAHMEKGEAPSLAMQTVFMRQGPALAKR